MDFISILDLREKPDGEQPRASFFQDLNIDRVIREVCREWGEDVSSFYYDFPADRDCGDYRREVFADVKQPPVFEALLRFVRRMAAVREAREAGRRVRGDLQAKVWYISEVKRYCEAFVELDRDLRDFPLKSRGLRSFCGALREYLGTEEFKRLREDAQRVRGMLDGVRLILTYENGRIALDYGEADGSYDAFLAECFPGNRGKLTGPFGTSADLSGLETEILKLIQKRQPELFRAVEDFCGSHGEYVRKPFSRFASEIRYYLAYHSFEKKMGEEGFAFAAPAADETKPMYARGLYDLALACVNVKECRPTVPNDVTYLDGERFFVLTGPNQGGKTTFARSLGQLVYFAKMGLDVPAAEANVHYFNDLLTHFSVEESAETGKGKLKEELTRLSPMMAAESRGAFVVINELFTTAANYDACIMGRRVLRHFTEACCRGIYVTHLKELAEEGGGIVSLRAMLDNDGRRSFRIERGEAAESASAASQVEKHRLTYSDLRKRLAPEDSGV